RCRLRQLQRLRQPPALRQRLDRPRALPLRLTDLPRPRAGATALPHVAPAAVPPPGYAVPMPLFRRRATVDQPNALSEGTAMRRLGIVFTEVGDDCVRGTMPVDDRTRQPYGLLHGGASVLLAETLG